MVARRSGCMRLGARSSGGESDPRHFLTWQVENPIHVTSLTWNPEGKITYQCISPPVDRFEGNTKGAGAVFGLLVGAGLDSGPASVGLPGLMLQQKLVQRLGFLGKQWSDEADVPRWILKTRRNIA